MEANHETPYLSEHAGRTDAGDQYARRALAARLTPCAEPSEPSHRVLDPETEARLGQLADLGQVSRDQALHSIVWQFADLSELGHARGGLGGRDPAEHLIAMLKQLFLPGIDHALRTVQLSEGEASLLVDVLKTSMFPQPLLSENDPGLLSDEIAEALEEDEENLSAKWGVDYETIDEKTRGWSWLQTVAVRDAADRFRRDSCRMPDRSIRELLRGVGLLQPEPTDDAIAATELSRLGLERQPDETLVLEPLDAAAWRECALKSAGRALVARLVGWEVVLILGEELRRWTRSDQPTAQIRGLVTTRPNGRRPNRSEWKDTFDVKWRQEARGYVLLAEPAARLLSPGPHVDVQRHPCWTAAERCFAKALQDEARNTPTGEWALARASNGDPNCLTQVAWERVRQFLASNRGILECVAAALVADRRLTVLTSDAVERLLLERRS